jgi:hypothetical protein
MARSPVGKVGLPAFSNLHRYGRCDGPSPSIPFRPSITAAADQPKFPGRTPKKDDPGEIHRGDTEDSQKNHGRRLSSLIFDNGVDLDASVDFFNAFRVLSTYLMNNGRAWKVL